MLLHLYQSFIAMPWRQSVSVWLHCSFECNYYYIIIIIVVLFRVKMKIYVLLNLSCLTSSKPVNKCVLLITLSVMVIVYIYFLYNETSIEVIVCMGLGSGIGLWTPVSAWIVSVNKRVFCISNKWELKTSTASVLPRRTGWNDNIWSYEN